MKDTTAAYSTLKYTCEWHEDLSTFAGMLKKLAALTLLLAFVAQTFSAPFIRLDYFFSPADYARNCINKARPKMHCNGQCQVMKKIREEEKKEQQSEERKMSSKLEVLFGDSYPVVLQAPFLNTTSTYIIHREDALSKMPRTVFHPPL